MIGGKSLTQYFIKFPVASAVRWGVTLTHHFMHPAKEFKKGLLDPARLVIVTHVCLALLLAKEPQRNREVTCWDWLSGAHLLQFLTEVIWSPGGALQTSGEVQLVMTKSLATGLGCKEFHSCLPGHEV